jgi:hypothetical protein
MYIKDIQKYTKLHICPKCGYISPATDHKSYYKEHFEEHVNNCKGKLSKSICLNEQSIPFILHIQKNPTFAYLLAHNHKNKYQVIQEYITYDFETVMKREIQKITDKTSYTQQQPPSVTYYINNNESKTSKFLYRRTNVNEIFINNWFNSLFTDVQKIFESQVSYYNSLDLLQYILNRLSFTKNNKYNISVKVIGFNSKNFDVNIF